MHRRKVTTSILFLVSEILVYLTQTSAEKCLPTEKTCRFRLEVKRHLAMFIGKEKVISQGGTLYKCDGSSQSCIQKISPSDVIVLNGDHVAVLAFNESIPGPPLFVYKGQEVMVTVINRDINEGVSVHWHGMEQRGTPYMDGVTRITQCPILPGESFTYKFKASPSGTHWYHSHAGAQRANGLFGAFIVKERLIHYDYDDEYIMNVGDWHSEDAQQGYLKMLTGYYIGNQKYETTKTLDGANFSALPWDSGIIEGMGANQDTPKKLFTVLKNKKYRFRVIGSGELYPLRLSIDNHRLLLVESDGSPLKPRLVQSLIINPGERYDFILHANQHEMNYRILAHSIEVGKQTHFATAVLHYANALRNDDPSSAEQCTKEKPCDVVNCPFPKFPINSVDRCITYNDLKHARDNLRVPDYVVGKSEEHFLNFAFPGKNGNFPSSVNGRVFVAPSLPVLTQPKVAELIDCKKDKRCGPNSVCHCYSSLQLPRDETVQLVLTNLGTGQGWAHPIHIHGHGIAILKVGYAKVNSITGKIAGPTDDITCVDSYCNVARWTNSSWEGDNIPGVNLLNPPIKDTILVPPGGYVVARIKTGNPGKWFVHCHIEIHLLDGMAIVLDTGSSPAVPVDFPKCGSPKLSAGSRDQQVKGVINALMSLLSTLLLALYERT